MATPKKTKNAATSSSRAAAMPRTGSPSEHPAAVASRKRRAKLDAEKRDFDRRSAASKRGIVTRDRNKERAAHASQQQFLGSLADATLQASLALATGPFAQAGLAYAQTQQMLAQAAVRSSSFPSARSLQPSSTSIASSSASDASTLTNSSFGQLPSQYGNPGAPHASKPSAVATKPSAQLMTVHELDEGEIPNEPADVSPPTKDWERSSSLPAVHINGLVPATVSFKSSWTATDADSSSASLQQSSHTNASSFEHKNPYGSRAPTSSVVATKNTHESFSAEFAAAAKDRNESFSLPLKKRKCNDGSGIVDEDDDDSIEPGEIKETPTLDYQGTPLPRKTPKEGTPSSLIGAMNPPNSPAASTPKKKHNIMELLPLTKEPKVIRIDFDSQDALANRCVNLLHYLLAKYAKDAVRKEHLLEVVHQFYFPWKLYDRIRDLVEKRNFVMHPQEHDWDYVLEGTDKKRFIENLRFILNKFAPNYYIQHYSANGKKIDSLQQQNYEKDLEIEALEDANAALTRRARRQGRF